MHTTAATQAIGAYIDADIPVFVWGAPGIGKSDTVAAIARDRSLPLIDLRATLLDPVDLRGLPHIHQGIAKWATPAFLPDATRDGPAGILFLDELNAAPPSTQAACFQLVLNRALGEYQMPAGWRIVAAGNRQSDRAAAQRMPSALANRFAHIDVEADPEAWCQWATRSGIEPVVIAFIRFRPNLLHNMPQTDARAFPTPRSWAQVSKVIAAPDTIRYSLIAGLVGEAAAAEFSGFLKVFLTIPRLSDIIADPTGTKVPTDPATMYAVTAAIARKADRSTFAPILTYAARLPKEFEILAAVDATRRDSSLTQTSAFVSWASRNAEVLS